VRREERTRGEQSRGAGAEEQKRGTEERSRGEQSRAKERGKGRRETLTTISSKRSRYSREWERFPPMSNKDFSTVFNLTEGREGRGREMMRGREGKGGVKEVAGLT
jgi:hypothetical protein